MASIWIVEGLDRESPLKESLARMLRKRFEEMWSHAADASSKPSVKTVHDMRVAARRVQGIMRLFKNEFPPRDFRKHDRAISGLIKALGRVREFDVNILAVRKFKKTLSAEDGKALSVLLIRDNAVRREHCKILTREVKKLRSAKYDKAALRFFESLSVKAMANAHTRNRRTATIPEQTRKLIPPMFHALIEHADHVIADPSAIEELHEMRLAGKPLRYLMEVSAQFFGEPFSECLAEMKSFLDIAGTIHDCDVLIALLEDFLKSWDGPEPRRSNSWSKTSRAGIVKFIRHERTLRKRKFAELTRMVACWHDQNFFQKLLKSMPLPTVTHVAALKSVAGERSSLFTAES